ncbi:FliI/YscN family ATPase [Jatrophihabitans telluris]|uniref:FliI/YscN family ATPase n=2 Tax=Jatrophihabitans telluris TaxID=2038343 RepID=A0ABY4R3D0_9ACTN|nr:FliI/YscN family ATPase [Jatrophihabitans telluris]UQX90329.1 FliI/YscN family ATPase [Jatrophihabitans telluris]
MLLAERLGALTTLAAPRRYGQVSKVVGLSVTVSGLSARIGDLIALGDEHNPTMAEVVAVDGDVSTCLPLGEMAGIGGGVRATSTGAPLQISVGDALRGRVLDGLGRPLDGANLPSGLERVTVEQAPPPALLRQRVDRPLTLGVRAIDSMITVGRGQRLGIFAGSGVGKSSLMSMITRGTTATVTVVALIGERGREVREFLENDLGEEGLRNAVVIVATSDQPPMVRLRAAFVATRIAEWFRDAGQDVLLLMDSITRLATAQREVGLSAGEPPASRGYPPSVFAMMPRLLERAGGGEHGSITGLYTVLVEGEDHNEPVADTARSILDGHIVLDRRLATAGHFPSIDVLESVSRVVSAVTSKNEQALARQARRLMAARRDVKELVEIGAYVSGTNPAADQALAVWPALEAFLQQPMDDQSTAEQAWEQLAAILPASTA